MLAPQSPAVRRFLLIYLPVVFVLAALTMTMINPFALADRDTRLLGILPMLGFGVLLAGALLGGLIIYMMDEKEFGKQFAIGGVLVTLVFCFAISHLMRETLIHSVGYKRGRAAARRVIREQHAYVRPDYNRLRHGGYMAYFLTKDSDDDTLRSAFFEGYNTQFTGRHSDLVDTDALRREGYADGYRDATAQAEGFAFGGRPSEPPHVEEAELPTYNQGYRQGYEAGRRTR